MYDSATPTALALRAYERANLQAQARRARLNQGYGLNEDGSMNADTSGSIYQGNLDSVDQMHGAELQDRRRGFTGTGGLANKSGARTQLAGLMRQSGMLREAFGNIADTKQDEQNNKGLYEDQLTQIRANSAQDAAETLAANLVRQREAEAAEAARQQALAASRVPASAPAPTLRVTPQTLKQNPRIGQTARNRY
jgi:hypothetical protein